MRPKKCRLVRCAPSVRFYKPRGIPLCDLEIVPLKEEEWEAVLLTDYDRLDHEQAAKKMGVSRPTFSRVLAGGRIAIAKALAEGAALEIAGGDAQVLDCASGKEQRCPGSRRTPHP